ncbi:Subunit of the Dam1 (DASH) complex [Candida albicans P57055]|nr:Subunit of the Dam1 (DASH) complex [Candida albicans P57055]
MSSTPVTPQTNSSSKVTVSTSREVALEQELSQITNINAVLEQFLQTIEKVNGDLNQINNGATNTMILMNKWTDIMSQADFTLDVINNSGWIPNDEYDNEFGEGQQQQQDDNEDEQEIEAKLRALEQENLEISKKIENQAKEKNAKMNRAREIDSKRKRELGLFNVRKKASR